jgi:hypothetical protein
VVTTQARRPDGLSLVTIKKQHGAFLAALAERSRLLEEQRQLARLMLELVLHRLSAGGAARAVAARAAAAGNAAGQQMRWRSAAQLPPATFQSGQRLMRCKFGSNILP